MRSRALRIWSTTRCATSSGSSQETFASRPHGVTDVRLEVTTGKPAPEILRVSRDKQCDLIVMSSHGLTGFRKLFFGSTTERVLRETSVPVLVTPGTDAGPDSLEDVRKIVRRVMAPVDLTAATPHQLRIARGLAEGLAVPLLVLHIVEPVRVTVSALPRLPKVEAERRYRAEQNLKRALEDMPAHIKAEALIAYGEPAEEIAKVASDRDAGTRRHGTELVSSSRSAHGFGHISGVVPGPPARAGAAAVARRVGLPRYHGTRDVYGEHDRRRLRTPNRPGRSSARHAGD